MFCPYCDNLIAYNSYFNVFHCPKCDSFFKQASMVECNDLNEPLTLDEIRKNAEQPLWFVNQNGGHWAIMSTSYLCDRKSAEYGKT